MAFKPATPEGAIKARTTDVRPTDTRQNNAVLGRPLDTGKLLSDFRDEEFRRVIRQHGKVLTWEKALLCPCQNATSRQATLACPLCDGSGYTYLDAIEIQGLMLSAERNIKIYERFGEWAEGSAFATVEPEHRLGYRDKLAMQDAIMPFSELLTKGNRRGKRSKLPSGVDSARYRIHRITHLATQDGSGALVQLEAGIHYQIDANGWIEWLAKGDEVVADGALLTILYETHPTYIVVSHSNVWRDDVISTKRPEPVHTALPIRAMLKLDYLLDPNTPA